MIDKLRPRGDDDRSLAAAGQGKRSRVVNDPSLLNATMPPSRPTANSSVVKALARQHRSCGGAVGQRVLHQC